MQVGIDAIAFYVPKIYLSIEEFAKARNQEAAKLQKGLGLQKMAFIDTHEDAATMMANALLKLILDNQISPKDIGRIYLGTESSLDGAKPTATYAVEMVEGVLEEKFGANCLRNIDVLDATFACIGAVDMLHNTVDYVRVNPEKIGIVVASDYAKYELNSSGEYTQGAGAVAFAVSVNPSIAVIENHWGVSTKSEHDFFKPRRYVSRNVLANPADTTKAVVEIFKDEPVFDGQFSNECYKDRIREAYFDFKKISSSDLHSWEGVVFHLPYAYHGRRIFSEIFGLESGYLLADLDKEKLKEISQTAEYKEIVKNKIEPTERASSELGNLYTASIFMAFVSFLAVASEENKALADKKIGFIAYGSGSKSKVFEVIIQKNWKEKVQDLHLFETLENRTALSFEQYENLHNKALNHSIITPKNEFAFTRMETENPNQLGDRFYSRF